MDQCVLCGQNFHAIKGLKHPVCRPCVGEMSKAYMDRDEFLERTERWSADGKRKAKKV